MEQERFISTEEHRRIRELFEAITDATAEGLLVIANNGAVVLANRRFRDLWNPPDSWFTMTNRAARLQWLADQTCMPGAFLRQIEAMRLNPQHAEYCGTIELCSGLVLEGNSRPYLIEGRMAGRVWSMRNITRQHRAEIALRESESRSRLLAEHARDVIFRLRLVPTMHYEYISPAVTDVLGYTPDDYYADPMLGWKILYPEDRSRFELLLKPEQPTTNEFVVRAYHKDGSTIWLEYHHHRVFDRRDTLVALEGITRDVTRYKHIEEALRQSHWQLEQRVEERTAKLIAANRALQNEIEERKQVEETLHFQVRLLNAIGQAVIATRLDGTIIYWNRAAETLYGWPANEVLGRTITSSLVLPETPEQGFDILQRLSSGTPWDGEFLVRRRDGTTFPAWVNNRPLYDERGNLAGIIGISSDISERKQAEAALAASEARYRTLVETSPGAILLTDLDSTITFCNRQAALLFGFASVDELVGTSSANLLAPSMEPLHQAQMIASNNQMRNVEYTLCRKDGRQFPAEINSSVVHDGQGNPSALIVVVHDISARRQAEQTLIEHERFVANARLAATVAHEVNTPLHTVQSILEESSHLAPHEQEHFFALAHAEIERISHIIHQLGTLYGPEATTPAAVDMNALIDRVLLLNRMLLARKGVQVERTLTAGLPPVHGRSDHFIQVLINLLFNALEAMPQGGLLSIHTHHTRQERQQEQPTVGIDICDTGAGIPADVLEHIFEPFFTTRRGGTGLGLAICRSILADYGGTIAVQSQPRVGTQVRITLPACAYTRCRERTDRGGKADDHTAAG